MTQTNERKKNTVSKIKGLKPYGLYYKYHVSELVGIAAAFIMLIITLIPSITKNDPFQILVALFFLEIMLIRLILFIWYHKTKNKKHANLMPPVMMLLTAVIVFLTRSIYIAAVTYQLVVNHSMFISDYTFLAVAYGIYTLGKIVLAVYGLIQKRKIDLYMETLSYLGWICAVYTLALFVNYLMHAIQSENLLWINAIVILLMALSTIVLIIMMLVKSIKGIIQYIRASSKAAKGTVENPD